MISDPGMGDIDSGFVSSDYGSTSPVPELSLFQPRSQMRDAGNEVVSLPRALLGVGRGVILYRARGNDQRVQELK